MSHTLISPSDMVGPSPVTSNGTDATEIEDEASDEAQEPEGQISPPSVLGSVDSQSTVNAVQARQGRFADSFYS